MLVHIVAHKAVVFGAANEAILHLWATHIEITILEAVLISQINKAIGGDNTAAAFLRDTSGNKLKDSSGETTVSFKFEDL